MVQPKTVTLPVLIEDYNDIINDRLPNTTRNIMTKYERTAVISLRLQQLARGAPPCIDVSTLTDMRSIALQELEQKTLPFIIVRSLPNDRKEYWPIREMVVLPD